MLKLEKIAKTRELNILLRSRQRFLTVTFICALGYALLIHFGALLVFKIAPFQVNYQQSLFPPVIVATELPIQHGVYSTNQHLEEQEPIPAYLVAPLPMDPMIPKAYKMSPIVTKESIVREVAFSIPIFPEEEIRILGNKEKVYELLNFHLSGGAIALSPINVYAPNEQTNTASYRVLFNVQIDQMKGEIFWWEMIEGPKNKKFQNYAIEALKGLKFIQHTMPDIISGEIEITMASKNTDGDF